MHTSSMRSKPNIKVLDAVMGTGKTTYITLKIKADSGSRYIVVLPRRKELKRYEEKLSGIHGLVSLYENHSSNSKKERFEEALEHAPVILITHALFERYLNENSFRQIRQGRWKLVMDEVVTAFETVEVTDVDISGLCTEGALNVKEVRPGIELLEADPFSLQAMGGNRASLMHKNLLRESMIKDLYRLKSRPGCHYYTFSLQEQRLTVFEEVTILTYPFKDTDLDYWFQIKGIEVEHLELNREGDTKSLSDFTLKPHTGHYSGRKFKERIEFLDVPIVRGKPRYGQYDNHFSAESMKKYFKPRKKGKERQIVNNALRTLFRNKRGRMIEPEDFMFSCRKDSMAAFRDSKNGLTKEFISEETFVPFNERATNDYDHKHYLAYLYNVFPFPPIERMIEAHGLTYNADRWALYILIQWIWRSAIRRKDGGKIFIYLPSQRMRRILKAWLNA